MKVFLTGAGGMLGLRLLRRLLERDHDVCAMVYDAIAEVKSRHLEQFGLDIVVGDVRSPSTFQHAMEGADTVIHLAAASHLHLNSQLFSVNAGGTANVIDAALKSDVERFILVSSVSAAGKNADRKHPMNESDEPQPSTAYGRSRLLAEAHVNKAHRDYGFKTTILRPCWLYGAGPGISPRMLRFISAIQRGRVPLWGDGENRNSLTYVGHLESAIFQALGSRRAVGRTYFIADEEPLPMMNIYSAVADALDVNLRTFKLPRVFLDQVDALVNLGTGLGFNFNTLRLLSELGSDITCSIDEAISDFDYEPHMSFPKGIKESVEWLSSEGHLPRQPSRIS